MEQQNFKCVMVIDESLPLGIISNTAAVMGITIGRHFPKAVGMNVIDQPGREHLGIVDFQSRSCGAAGSESAICAHSFIGSHSGI